MISLNLSAVSLRDLALVQAVSRHGSFNSAARAMHISPSGLSHQVQKVEQALGTTLFERGGRRVVPTAGGQRLLEQIDAVLAAAEHLQQAARAGATAFGGELRLGVPVSLGPYLLPHLVDPFPQHFPGARLSLSEGKPRGLLRRLHEGELDAVLAPPSRPASGIAMRPLFFEPWELMLRADHPLAGRRSAALDQLDPGQAILMAESHADGLDGQGGHVQDVSLESLAALLGLRGGYALVPALARERLASMPGMVLLKIRGDAPGREIALYWREATPWHADLQALAELLRKLARQRPGLRVLGAA
ncbi:LysR family transcriptional regulator [Fulvimonas soli]|jgi:LysR family hydrogen peroxide-inducible transcriptional activator|uniref:LysR family hydrogen peroxide-inducible transcriptional activator n=1 Tax=Fulvimonas soli TaxID=155197 RepID=A0A316IAW4_9GAMM|nr:LysR substrate-binding domain-containing protein [Fulvimonas soli]PWK89879.1 LysR family hydrogen peroxide-inducible transcriptional activator [Fulvimonas soli]TNY27484.1 LysR family transcriptional regulator [Fulvimonas soli]